MRLNILIGFLLTLASCEGAVAASPGRDLSFRPAPAVSDLQAKQWIHGSADCDVNTEPAIDAYSYESSSFIFRQNKCLSFEAPFIYVFSGEQKVLVVDTGDSNRADEFPLYETVMSMVGTGKEILVVHSHSHRDHYRGDELLIGKPGVQVVGISHDEMTQYFGFMDWPEGKAKIDLGGRVLTVIPSPGHQEEAVTIYDPVTGWLLTGDTLYPGVIYVKHWAAYRQTIERLASFAKANRISAIMGSHIEMTSEPKRPYPIGSTHQPDEHALPLDSKALEELHRELMSADGSERLVFDHFIIEPMGAVQKILSNFGRWISQ